MRLSQFPLPSFAVLILASAASLPAQDLSWAGVASGDWSDSSLWSPTGVPDSSGETATIDAINGSNYTVTLDDNFGIDAFTLGSGQATLSASGKTFTVSGSSLLSLGAISLSSSTYTSNGVFTQDGGTLSLTSSTLNGSGSYQKNDGGLNLNLGTLGIATTQTSGSTTVIGSSTMSAGFTNESAGLVTLNNGRALTVNNAGFTNEGQFDFAIGGSTSRITTGNGQTFTNSPTGVLNVKSGATGPRNININFDNQGQLNANSPTRFDLANGTYINSGTITAPTLFTTFNAETFTNSSAVTSTGGTLTFDGNTSGTSRWENSGTVTAANGMTITQFEDITNSGLIDLTGGNLGLTIGSANATKFTNSGEIEVPAGQSCTFTNGGFGGTLTFEDGSTLDGGGNLTIGGFTLMLGGAYNPGTSPLVLTSTILSGAGSLTIDNGNTLTATSCTFNTPLTSHGTLTLNTNTFNSPFNHESDAVLTLNNARSLRFNNHDFTNHGQFDFAIGGSTSKVFSGTGQTFINSPTGILNVKSGATGPRSINLNFNNQGQLNANSATRFDLTSGVYTNSGTITAPTQLTTANIERFTNSNALTSTGGALTFDGNTSATSLWQNSGTVTVANGMTISQFKDITNSGLIDLTGGNLGLTIGVGNATQFTNSGDIEVPAGQSCTFTNGGFGGTLTFANGSTLDGGGNLTIGGFTLMLGGAYNPGPSPLVLNSTILSGAGSLTIDNGNILTATSCTFNTPLTSHGTLTLNTNTFNSPFNHESDAVLTLNNARSLNFKNHDFTNHGQFDFAIGGSTSKVFSGTGQTFINSPTGTLNVKSGATGPRSINLNFDNQGLLNANSPTRFDLANGIYSNSGTISALRDLTTVNVESFTNTNTLTSTSGLFTFDGNTSGTSRWENSGTVTAANGMTISQFVDITNSGLIDLTGGNLGFTIGVGNATQFTNSGDIEVPAGQSCTFTNGGFGGTLTFANGSTLDGGGNLTIGGFTLMLGGAYNPGPSPLVLNSTILSGAGSLTIDNGNILTATSCTFNTPLTSHGTLTLNTNTFNSPFNHESDAVLTLNNARSLNFKNHDFTNHGQFDFAIGGSTSKVFSGTGQTFINSPTGTLNVKSGATGPRSINLNFDNQGLLNANSPTRFDLANGIYSNSGTITAPTQLTTANIESFTNSNALTSTGGALVFDGNNSGTSLWQNSGTITIANGMTIAQFENVTNSGTIALQGGTVSVTLGTGSAQQFINAGEIQVGAGLTFTLGSGGFGGTVTNDAGARLSGLGTFTTAIGSLNNDGIIAPGTSPGVLTFNSSIVNSATAEFEIEIASDADPGTGHDMIVVNGNLALNGTLKPVLPGAFVPTPTDTFVIMSATGDITGNFAAVQQPPASVGTFNVTVDEALDQVLLTFTPAPKLTYEEFQNLYFTEQQILDGDADPDVDFDGDRLTNFAEWIHGQDPTRAGVTVPILRIDDDEGPLDLTYAESRLLPDDSYVVTIESTLDLSGTWDTVPETDWALHSEVTIPGLDNIQFVTLRITDPAWAGDGERYFRLRFSAVEP